MRREQIALDPAGQPGEGLALCLESVASQANTCTVLNSEMVMLAAANMLIAIWFMPVANMWCTHTPMPTTPVSTVATAT